MSNLENLDKTIADIKQLSIPLVNYLEKHFDPYTTVNISIESVNVSSILYGIPVKKNGKSN